MRRGDGSAVDRRRQGIGEIVTLRRLKRYIGTTEAKVTAGTGLLLMFRRLVNSGVVFILAPSLGAAAYGVYAFAFATLNVLGILCLAGLGMLAIREVAQLQATARTGLLHGFLRYAAVSVTAASLAVSGLVAVVVWQLGAGIDQDQRLAIAAVSAILPFFALSALGQAVLTGLKHILLAQLPETVIRPVIFAVLVLGAVAAGFPLSGAAAMALFAVGAVLGFAFAAASLWRKLPAGMLAAAAEYRTADWARGAAVLWLNSLYQTVNLYGTPIILTLLADPTATGVFALCFALTNLIPFVAFAVERAFSPQVAALWAQGERQRLQANLVRMVRLSFLAALPIALVVLAGGGALLGLFGAQYAVGGDAIRILALGQLASIGLGQPYMVLVMIGEEKATGRVVLARTVAALALNFVLVPLFGLTGAAVAQSGGLVLSQLAMARLVRRRAGLGSTIVQRLPAPGPGPS